MSSPLCAHCGTHPVARKGATFCGPVCAARAAPKLSPEESERMRRFMDRTETAEDRAIELARLRAKKEARIRLADTPPAYRRHVWTRRAWAMALLAVPAVIALGAWRGWW